MRSRMITPPRGQPDIRPVPHQSMETGPAPKIGVAIPPKSRPSIRSALH